MAPPKAQTPINAQAQVLQLSHHADWREAAQGSPPKGQADIVCKLSGTEDRGRGNRITGDLCADLYLSYCHHC